MPVCLQQSLEAAALQSPAAGILYLGLDGAETFQSYAGLSEAALRILTGLRHDGLTAGSTVVLQLDDPADFLPAFWACVLGGIVPVPMAAVRADAPGPQALERLRQVWGNLGRPSLIARRANFDALRALGNADDPVDLLDVEALRRSPAAGEVSASLPDDTAVLFATSGSTGMAKLVPQTHRSLLAHASASALANRFDTSDVTLNWLPLEHVGGLVMFHLRDVQVGCRQIHASMQDVILRPVIWLDWMHRYRVTVSWAPHFAYALVAAAPRDALDSGAWDLSCLRQLVNGGEAIVARQAQRFMQRLAPHRLSASAMVPAWGMSETCSGVTFSDTFGAELASGDGAVPVGKPIAGIDIRIVDAQGQPLADGEVGQVQVKGVLVTRGYVGNDQANRDAFTADGWFRTGDLGMLVDGSLTITGREKDVIIVNGLNVSCHEIEAVVERVPGVLATCTAAFGSRSADAITDRIVIVFCAGAPGDDIEHSVAATIRASVVSTLGLNPEYIVATTPARIPRTDIGKIQRQVLRQMFERGDLGGGQRRRGSATRPPAVTDAAHPASVPGSARFEVETRLTAIWSEVLCSDRIGPNDGFFDLGGQSLQAIQILARVRIAFGRALSMRALFEAPTIARMAALLDTPQSEAGGSEEADPALGDLHAGQGAIPRLEGSGPSIASSGQEALWFLDRLLGPSSLYNESLAVRLLGTLDIGALERSLQALADRHACLRTSLDLQAGQLVQIEHAHIAIDLPVRGIEDAEPAPREQALHQILQREAGRPFNLTRAPLLRARLLRLDQQHHALVLVIHHIVSDGWSLAVLVRELGALYAALVSGKPGALAPLPIRFSDFVAWQRGRVAGPDGARQLQYWRTRLAGLQPLQLPADRLRPARPTYQGGQQPFVLDAPLTAGLKVLARRHDTTLFMVLLGAFQTLMMRWSGQHDLAVGTPVAGRDRTELEGLVGYFVNMLVLRADLSGDPGFDEFLARVRDGALEAFSHHEVPFDQLVAELRPDREDGMNPLFQVSFALHNMPDRALSLPGLRCEPLPVHSGRAKFDLSMSLSETGDCLHGQIEFSSELFLPATIARMAGHFQTLLGGILADPACALSRLPLMDDAERHKVLVEWNDTAAPYPADQCVHRLFEAQVARTPNAIAVEYQDGQLTYIQLNRRANRLAHHLRQLGVGPDARVGICVERSLELVVGLLGILKAGGAYLPLDATYPRDRLAFMLADAAPKVLLTQQRLLDALPGHPQTVCLDRDWPSIERWPADGLADQALPGHLAYVIYTSGSTGQPKGVLIEHRALVNHMTWMARTFPLAAGDAVVQKTPCSFDASVWEFFAPLLAGARLVVAGPQLHRDAVGLADLVRERRVHTLQVVPTLLGLLLDTPAFADCASLRRVFCGGEALPADLVDRFQACLPGADLINLYGPTEATIDATCRACLKPSSYGAPSIGRPIANTRIYILDDRREPVPVGVAGELYIAGAGLARGYLDRPELTAERFVADSFAGHAGARMYRTGDLARWRADGDIEFLGRVDSQVKVRGFRVEPGEIEGALRRCAGVRDAVVMVRERAPGDQRLVAWFVPEPCASAGAPVANAKALRRSLRAQLPDFMIPTEFVRLDAITLTANGKIDRQALLLPPLSMDSLPGTAEPVAAAAPDPAGGADTRSADAVEQRLATIWQDVLKTSPVGLDDNFFELGGHSLLAVHLLAAIEREFSRMLRLSTLFESPTVRQLAQTLRLEKSPVARSCVVAVQPGGKRPPLFFVSGWGGAILVFNDLARELGPEHPLYVLDTSLFGEQASGPVLLEQVAGRMIDDMRAIQPSGPYNLCGFSLGGKFVYEMAQQLHRSGDTVSLLALMDGYAPGYPVSRPFAVRTLLHIGHALRLGPAAMIPYLVERVRRLKKYFVQVGPKLFAGDELAASTAVVRAMQQSADVMLQAWRAYRPGFYPGHLALIRAEVKDPAPGVIDDDPQLGWGRLIGNGIEIHRMYCNHRQMLDAPHAPALARILSGCLPRGHQPRHESDALMREPLS